MKKKPNQPKDQQEKWVKDLYQKFSHTDIHGNEGTPLWFVPLVEQFIKDLLAQERERAIKEIEKYIKGFINYCEKQNGVPYCKNCGLDAEDVKEFLTKLRDRK